MSLTGMGSMPGEALTESLFKDGTVLLESQLRSSENYRSYLFKDPLSTIWCTDYSHVAHGLKQIRDATDEGLYAAGFISYEAGLAVADRQRTRHMDGFPLIWMGLYDRVGASDSPLVLPAPPRPEGDLIPVLNVSRSDYVSAVERIKEWIRDGETYQVNYTCRMRYDSEEHPVDTYLRLRRSHPVPYGALLNCGGFTVISQSPELFLRRTGDILITRPMKGTAPRGYDREEDRRSGEWLRNDPKNRAENLMIVDLMRNDLGRISQPGTVEVFDPFTIEPYGSLFQMTSGVRCRLREGTDLPAVLAATFPPGSITGAPKVRTMQLIGKLENEPRKVYTGAIGAFFPGGDFVTNVAIRTVIAYRDGGREMGVGSGIVIDSSPEEEYGETILKSRFLTASALGPHRLLETILLTGEGDLVSLIHHLDRMERSACALNFPFSRSGAEQSVRNFLGPDPPGPAVVRLLLDRRGDYQVELSPLEDLGRRGPIRVRISPERIEYGDPIRRHKTTDRFPYDEELAGARGDGFAEALFLNTEGQITEGAFTNIFLLVEGEWRTPPLSCGLLPGIWRENYLSEVRAREVSLTPIDLTRASRVVIGNSVRGTIEVDEVVDDKGEVLFSRGESGKKKGKIRV
ncbi:MAG: aminodeoxychorismate synthase component I [bacterium]|nr:MAG: aminodeoxychorismate synthase component I [bacterium]